MRGLCFLRLVLLEAFQVLPYGFLSGWPGDAPGIETRADGLAHFGTDQACAHGPQQEFVIIERDHGIAVGGNTRWALGVEKGK
jgi:hypothetical protein